MAPKWLLVILIISAGFSLGCDIETPEIRGVVLDAETKQPVAEAWIFATLEIRTRTIQGEVDEYLAIESPHTRSNERGEFVIPARKFNKPMPPHGFGTKVLNFIVHAETIDNRHGLHHLRDYEWKEKVNIIIYMKPLVESEGQDFLNLQSLYDYCSSGRRGVTVPAVKGGCDEWELNYAITKHERFLKRLGEPKTSDQRSFYSNIMKQLAYLYKKKGEYKEALDLFMTLRELDRQLNIELWLKEYENQIKELQQLIQEKEK